MKLLGGLVGSQLPQPHLLSPGATRVYVVYAYGVRYQKIALKSMPSLPGQDPLPAEARVSHCR